MRHLRLPFAIAAGAAAVAFACTAYDESAPVPAPPPRDAGSASDGGDENDGGHIADASAAHTWLPVEGTYRYRVAGRQSLNLGTPQERDEGPIAPAELRREAGKDCWKLRLCLVSGKCDEAPSGAYSEVAWSFCVDDGRLEQRAMRESIRWTVFGVMQQVISDVTCEPGQALYATADNAMMSWGHVCQGMVNGGFAFSSSGPYRYLGEDTITIGGAAHRAYHYAEDRTVSATRAGAPSGKQSGEWWFAPNGLPLRIRRGVDIESNIGFGNIEFRQFGTMAGDAGAMNDCVLDSLEPAALPDGG